jgi:hypothetical protein
MLAEVAALKGRVIEGASSLVQAGKTLISV